MSYLFISDIHLSLKEPTITNNFLYFLRTRVILSKALYILGDLFEIWIGDDDPNPLHKDVSAALKNLSQRGIACYFIHGNHDFLLSKTYADTCGMKLLYNHQFMQIGNYKILILHGDILCTNDINYQRFRKRVNQRWLQLIFLSLPLRWRIHIAYKLLKTKLININQSKKNMDVNNTMIMDLMEYYGATLMIHGHTHLPAMYLLNKGRLRLVLGSWHKQGSAIEVQTTGIKMIKISLCKN